MKVSRSKRSISIENTSTEVTNMISIVISDLLIRLILKLSQTDGYTPPVNYLKFLRSLAYGYKIILNKK